MTASTPRVADRTRARRAMGFVVMLGVVSLFGDMTYEGARSIVGPYLNLLGASSLVIGLVSGLGEFLGYALRLPFGLFADRTHRYWPITIAGYAVNLFAVPLLAMAGSWQLAAVLVVAERAGRAMRKPAGDAMLSYAASEMGRGWGFGLREAMDQTGAVLGPLCIAWAIAHGSSYTHAFALLAVPAALGVFSILAARSFYPSPEKLEVRRPELPHTAGTSGVFRLYVVAGACIAIGTADFPLVAFHLARTEVLDRATVPALYALAMGAAAVAAPLVGWIYDRRGITTVALASLAPIASTPLLFLGSARGAMIGIALWGAAMGVQEATVRAVVADLTPADRRASAYGLFDAAFGTAWLVGSTAMGALYAVGPMALVWFAIAAQVAAVLLLALVALKARRS